MRFRNFAAPLRRRAEILLARDRNFSSHLDHMKPDPGNNTADAIIGKKSVENADQCPRVTGVSQMPESEVQGRGTVRKLIQDPNCHAFVFADLPDRRLERCHYLPGLGPRFLRVGVRALVIAPDPLLRRGIASAIGARPALAFAAKIFLKSGVMEIIEMACKLLLCKSAIFHAVGVWKSKEEERCV